MSRAVRVLLAVAALLVAALTGGCMSSGPSVADLEGGLDRLPVPAGARLTDTERTEPTMSYTASVRRIYSVDPDAGSACQQLVAATAGTGYGFYLASGARVSRDGCDGVRLRTAAGQVRGAARASPGAVVDLWEDGFAYSADA